MQGTDNTEKVFLCLTILEASVQSKGPFYFCKVEKKKNLPQIPFKGMSQWSEGLWLSVLPPKYSASSQGAPSLHTRAVGTHSEQWQPTTAASRCRPDSSLELENCWVVLEIRVFVSGPSACLAGSKLMCLRGVWAGRVVGNFSFLLWKQACGVDMCILPWFLWCHLFCLSVFSLWAQSGLFFCFFFPTWTSSL